MMPAFESFYDIVKYICAYWLKITKTVKYVVQILNSDLTLSEDAKIKTSH